VIYKTLRKKLKITVSNTNPIHFGDGKLVNFILGGWEGSGVGGRKGIGDMYCLRHNLIWFIFSEHISSQNVHHFPGTFIIYSSIPLYRSLINQCLSLTLWVWISLMGRCTRYNIHYVIKFVTDLGQVGGFLRLLWLLHQ